MASKDFVTIIGTGNLAWHLAPALDNAGFTVKEVFGRSRKRAELLTGRLYQAEPVTSLDFSRSPSEIFVLAISDNAIEKVARELVLPDNAVLAHTSGSVPLSALGFAATNDTGVFYPLQTFSKEKKVNFEEIPVFIEAETSLAEKVLVKMAKTVSKRVHRIDSDDRKVLHVAAVFASNFTNHMLTLAKEVMDARKLKYEWLKPLIAETLNKSLSLDPEKAQTGPARRGDLEILEKHLELLHFDPELAEVYRVISQHIVDRYHEE